MPRKDPITGVPVMTNAEFMESVAKKNGITPQEAFDQTFGAMFDEMKKDEEARKKVIQENLLSILAEKIKEFNEADPEAEQIPVNFSIVNIISIEVRVSLRESREIVRAVVAFPDGSKKMLKYHSWSFAGTRDEPPDGDLEITLENV